MLCGLYAILQPYVSRKCWESAVFLAVFFTYRDNSGKPNTSRNFFPAIRNLKNGLGGLSVVEVVANLTMRVAKRKKTERVQVV